MADQKTEQKIDVGSTAALGPHIGKVTWITQKAAKGEPVEARLVYLEVVHPGTQGPLINHFENVAVQVKSLKCNLSDLKLV